MLLMRGPGRVHRRQGRRRDGQPPRHLPDALRARRGPSAGLRSRAARCCRSSRGETSTLHDAIFTEMTFHAAYEPQRAVRTERWKYIRRFDDYPHPVLANCDDSASKDLLVENGWGEQSSPRSSSTTSSSTPTRSRDLSPTTRARRRRSQTLRGRLEDWMRGDRRPAARRARSPLPPGAVRQRPTQVSPTDPAQRGRDAPTAPARADATRSPSARTSSARRRAAGSTLVCKALRATGVAGPPRGVLRGAAHTGRPRRPDEYFAGVADQLDLRPPRPASRGRRDRAAPPLWSRDGLRPLPRVGVRGRAPPTNGVFGAKLMWGYFGDFVSLLRNIPEYRDLPLAELLPGRLPGPEVRPGRARQQDAPGGLALEGGADGELERQAEATRRRARTPRTRPSSRSTGRSCASTTGRSAPARPAPRARRPAGTPSSSTPGSSRSSSSTRTSPPTTRPAPCNSSSVSGSTARTTSSSSRG